MLQRIHLNQNDFIIDDEVFINDYFFDLRKNNENQIYGVNNENQIVDISLLWNNTDLLQTQIHQFYQLKPVVVNFYQLEDYNILTTYDNLILICDKGLNIITQRKGQHGQIIGLNLLKDNSIIFISSDENIYILTKESIEKTFQTGDSTITNLQICEYQNITYIFVSMNKQIQIYKYLEQQQNIQKLIVIKLESEEQIDSMDIFSSQSAITLLFTQNTQFFVIEIKQILDKIQNIEDNQILEFNASEIGIQVTAHLERVNQVHMLRNRNIITTSLDKSLKLWSYGKQQKQTAQEKKEQIVGNIFDIFTGKVNTKLTFKLDKEQNRIQQIKVLQNVTKRSIIKIISDKISNRVLLCNADNRVDLYNYNENNIQHQKSFVYFNKPIRYANFINDGQQILAVQSDSIFKVINVQNSIIEFVGQCGNWQETETNRYNPNPFEQQQELERLNYLVLDAKLFEEEKLYSGKLYIGTGDGKIFYLEDDTELQNLLQQQENVKIIMQEQNYLNQLRNKEYNKAIINAIKLYNLRQISQVTDNIMESQLKNEISPEFKLELDFSDFNIQEILQTIRIVEQLSKYNKTVLIASFIFKELSRQVDLNFLNQMNYQQNIQNIVKNFQKALKRIDNTIGEIQTSKLISQQK